MNSASNWYILHTQHNRGSKLTQVLVNKGYPSFCPQFQDAQFRTLQDKQDQKNHLSSWVFVQCTEEKLKEIKKNGSSVHVVYRLDKPAIISQDEIITLKNVFQNFRNIKAMKIGIQSGTIGFSEQEGQTREGQTFSFPSLGYALLATEKMVTHEAEQAIFNAANAKHQSIFSKQKINSYLLLKKLPAFFGGKGFKLSSLLSKAT